VNESGSEGSKNHGVESVRVKSVGYHRAYGTQTAQDICTHGQTIVEWNLKTRFEHVDMEGLYFLPFFFLVFFAELAVGVVGVVGDMGDAGSSVIEIS
jgi:hypothetical protein